MSKQYRDGVEYGTFTDPRDGQEYRTITYEAKDLHRTYVVMASNLNYGKMVPVDSAANADGVVEKFCYNDDPWYCDNGFGGLYSWSEAMNIPRACDTVLTGSTPECPDSLDGLENALEGSIVDIRHQGICPDGWHVLNELEWRSMPAAANFGSGPMLSAIFGGTDRIGFSALLGGRAYPDQGSVYRQIGSMAAFWVGAEKDATAAYTVELGTNIVDYKSGNVKRFKNYLRCVKDY